MAGPAGTDWVWIVAGVMAGGFGLILLLWSLFWDRARGRQRCPKCWYDMQGAEADEHGSFHCPECGRVIKRERKLRKTRRRWRWVPLVAVLALSAAMLGMYPTATRNGWLATAPSSALVVAYPWLDTADQDLADELLERLYETSGRLPGIPVMRGRRGDRVATWQRRWLASRAAGVLLTSSEAEKRLTAVNLLRWIANCGPESDPFAPELLFAAEADGDENVQNEALVALKAIDWNFETISHGVERLLLDPDESIQVKGAQLAWLLGDYAADLHETLASRLDSENDDLRLWCSKAMCAIEPDNRSALDNLLESLGSDDREHREQAARQLGSLKSNGHAIIDDLIEILRSDDVSMQIAALEVVRQLGPVATDVAPVLRTLLEHENESVRSLAAEALASMESR